jgi:hypothetical protein
VTTDALTLAVHQFRWGDKSALAAIRTDEDFSLDELMQDLGRLEWQALGNVRRWVCRRQGRDEA